MPGFTHRLPQFVSMLNKDTRAYKGKPSLLAASSPSPYSAKWETTHNSRHADIESSLRKHPFLLALRRWARFARKNVPSYEERGQTDVFAGYIGSRPLNLGVQPTSTENSKYGKFTNNSLRIIRQLKGNHV